MWCVPTSSPASRSERKGGKKTIKEETQAILHYIEKKAKKTKNKKKARSNTNISRGHAPLGVYSGAAANSGARLPLHLPHTLAILFFFAFTFREEKKNKFSGLFNRSPIQLSLVSLLFWKERKKKKKNLV